MKRSEKLFRNHYKLAITLILINCIAAFSQSPSYTLKFSVTEHGIIDESSNFSIDVTTCRFSYSPQIPSNDYWFGRDTSQLNWQNLPDSVLKTISCENSAVNGRFFESSNQEMVWENIYAIKIVRNSSDTMMFVFPVKIKSFVTYIDLGEISFKNGIYDLTDAITYTASDNRLNMGIPKNYNWLPGEKGTGILKFYQSKQ